MRSDSKISLLIVSVTCLYVMSSCTRGTIIDPRITKGIDLKKFGIESADTVQALLLYHAGTFVEPDFLYVSANVQAFIFNEDTLIDVASVSVNNDSFDRLSQGVYASNSPTIPTSPPYSLSWVINDYLGGNFANTFNMATRISIANVGYMDTVYQSVGKTVTYSGSMGGELDVSTNFVNYLSELEIHPDSNTSNGNNIRNTVSDAGTFTLSSSDLSNLTPYRVYFLIIQHLAYSSTPYSSTKVAHYTSYSYTVPFILMP